MQNSDNSLILTSFNNHLVEFLDDIQSLFENDHAISYARNALLVIKKANPKLIIKIWYNYITLKYDEQIQNNNLDFFLEKDYQNDFNNMSSQKNEILKNIERLKEPIKNMGQENQLKSIKYFQNLCLLSKLYHT